MYQEHGDATTESPAEKRTWHSLTAEEVLHRLQVDRGQGLTAAELARRRLEFGANELRERPRPGFWQRLLNQFRSLMILLLIGSSILSGVLGEWPEAIAILSIVLLNALLGVVQEGRAEQALAALRKLAATEATVRREGQVRRVPERDLVPGDIVLLETGNFVPADLRLLEAHNLQSDEASLTGESLAVEKNAAARLSKEVMPGDRCNMAYKGSIITAGRAEGIVVATGMATEIGRIATLIENVPDDLTPLQMRLDALGRSLVYAALLICAIVFLLALHRDFTVALHGLPGNVIERLQAAVADPQRSQAIRVATLEALLTAVALAIAAVPEGLPAIVTINLALGMREMIKRHAVVRRLRAVETLGSVSVICSDKTGTLTQNEMTVVWLHTGDVSLEVSGEGYVPQGSFLRDGVAVEATGIPDIKMMLIGALLASDARLESLYEAGQQDYKIVGDPTEGALVVAAAKADLHRHQVESLLPRIDEFPFDSQRKRMSTLHQDDTGNGYILFVKGAPDLVLERCTSLLENGREVPLTAARREHILNHNRSLARQVLRVLAVAYRKFEQVPESPDIDAIEQGLTLLGLIAMQDRPRPEVKPAIEKARRAGIKTVMVTGDYPETASAVAQQVGLLTAGGRLVTGRQIEEMTDAELAGIVDATDIFARVSPEHKLRIVQAFHERRQTVAMTGDGVNDAPALKQADIGVAMGITGADVTRETADIVLSDDNYASIVGAVEQGRIIYNNIRKFTYYLLNSNLAEIGVIFIATLLGYPSPLTPLQILWLNLLSDGAPALALGVEKGEPDVMQQPPRPSDEPIVDRAMRWNIAVQALSTSTATLVAFFIGMWHSDLTRARLYAFVTLSHAELLLAYAARSERFLVYEIGVLGNRYMQYAVLTSLTMLATIIYWPMLHPVFATVALDLYDWAIIVPLALLPYVSAELMKRILRLPHRP